MYIIYKTKNHKTHTHTHLSLVQETHHVVRVIKLQLAQTSNDDPTTNLTCATKPKKNAPRPAYSGFLKKYAGGLSWGAHLAPPGD